MNAPELSKIVTFRLGEDFFAADIYSVERVLRYQSPTPIPNVPAWIEGVIEITAGIERLEALPADEARGSWSTVIWLADALPAIER